MQPSPSKRLREIKYRSLKTCVFDQEFRTFPKHSIHVFLFLLLRPPHCTARFCPKDRGNIVGRSNRPPHFEGQPRANFQMFWSSSKLQLLRSSYPCCVVKTPLLVLPSAVFGLVTVLGSTLAGRCALFLCVVIFGR